MATDSLGKAVRRGVQAGIGFANGILPPPECGVHQRVYSPAGGVVAAYKGCAHRAGRYVAWWATRDDTGEPGFLVTVGTQGEGDAFWHRRDDAASAEAWYDELAALI